MVRPNIMAGRMRWSKVFHFMVDTYEEVEGDQVRKRPGTRHTLQCMPSEIYFLQIGHTYHSSHHLPIVHTILKLSSD
jgi:hypothetical protein